MVRRIVSSTNNIRGLLCRYSDWRAERLVKNADLICRERALLRLHKLRVNRMDSLENKSEITYGTTVRSRRIYGESLGRLWNAFETTY